MTSSSASALRAGSAGSREPEHHQHHLLRQHGDHDHPGGRQHSTGARGIVALQGKPWVVAVNPADTDGVMQVRALTPTCEFVVGTGALPAVQRRAVVDTDACVKCHVGSLYQHGGNRVDNVKMCGMCHNSASTEQNVRTRMKVDKTKTYDGLNGQTYEFKTMLHPIHSSGHVAQYPIVIYRTNGIYAWAPECAAPELAGHWAASRCSDTGRWHGQGRPADPQLLCADVSAGVQRLRGLPRQGLRGDTRPAKAVATTLDAGRHDVDQTRPTTRCRAHRRLRARAATSRPTRRPTRIEWFGPGGVPEGASDHSRCEVSLGERGGPSGPPRSLRT